MPESISPPLVSVLVPTLNAERFLRQALESVHAQTYPALEIIVIDGPATDATAHIARSFPRVRYLRQTGNNMWNALNEGIASSRGQYLAMISSDDLWTLEKLQLQVDYLETHPETAYVFGLTRFVLIEGETVPRAFRPELFEGEREAIVLEALLVRKSVFEQVGTFDENVLVVSDVDWFARLIHSKLPRAILPHVVLFKRIHANNLSTLPERTQDFNHDLLTAMHMQLQRVRESAKNG